MAIKMSGVFVSCALSALLLSAAWADHNQHPPHHDQHPPHHDQRPPHHDQRPPHHHQHHSHQHHHHQQGRELSCHKLSSPNADFAFALYKHLNAKAAAGENIFYSPLGISTTLSMLSTGARGETHSQLFSSLGYSTLNQTQVNEAYEHLFHTVGQKRENEQLDIGNAVALRSGFSPLEKFLKDVRHHYSGEIFSVDFTKPDEAAAKINTYIANKTQDKIKDMVKDLDPHSIMVLVNCVYFKGEWKERFYHDRTHKADFHVDKTTTVQVDMMMKTDFYNTYSDAANHTTVVMLPYKGHSFMLIVLPDEGKMEEVEGYINKDYIKHWCDSLSRNYVHLFLPKYSIVTEASLETTLKELGITHAFEANADFSGVSPEVKLKVSQVSHKTTLSVTEEGTEASAATVLQGASSALTSTIKIDRPFLVFIMETTTRSILFMGKINNPTVT